MAMRRSIHSSVNKLLTNQSMLIYGQSAATPTRLSRMRKLPPNLASQCDKSCKRHEFKMAGNKLNMMLTRPFSSPHSPGDFSHPTPTLRSIASVMRKIPVVCFGEIYPTSFKKSMEPRQLNCCSINWDSSTTAKRKFSNNSKLSNLSTAVEAMKPKTAYSLLRLNKFTKSEIECRFDQIIEAGERACIIENKPPSKSNHGLQENLLPSQHLLEAESENENDNERGKKSQVEGAIHLQDLEAFLIERYLTLDKRWHENHAGHHEGHGQLLTHRVEENRLSQIKRHARIDAESMFQFLHQKSSSHKNYYSQILNNFVSSNQSQTLLPSLQNSAPSIDKPPIPSGNFDPNANPTQFSQSLTKQQFYKSLHSHSTQVHLPTILPLAASMLLVGTSVGVISPVMPFIAEKLSLSSSQYGVVVSSFAVTKMLGNVPSAILVERHGRKPYLVHSLLVVGVGVAGLGVAQDWIQLSGCRMVIGFGVAALTTASTLTVADVSTSVSRASAFAPVMSAFAAGTALGPALGGILCDEWGIRDTFLAVGMSYGILAAWNNLSLNETKRTGEWWNQGSRPPWHESTKVGSNLNVDKAAASSESTPLTNQNEHSSLATNIKHAMKDTANQWSTLMADPHVRPIVIMNGFYLCAISGTQMTLLPLLLTSGGAATAVAAAAGSASATTAAVATSANTATGLALTATAVGQVYMWMSAVQVLGNPAAGRFADRAGKQTAIVLGGTLSSMAMASVPLVCAYSIGSLDSDLNWTVLATTLGVWSLGGALLATSHVAAISDAVHDSGRSQAIALLRTSGDVGFLCGAAGAGLAADMFGDVGLAIQAGSGVLMGATVWFGLQTLALNRLEKKEDSFQKHDESDDKKRI